MHICNLVEGIKPIVSCLAACPKFLVVCRLTLLLYIGIVLTLNFYRILKLLREKQESTQVGYIAFLVSQDLPRQFFKFQKLRSLLEIAQKILIVHHFDQ